MRRLDHLSSVVNWSSEEVRIPYISPIDGKRHTYHPDFLVHVRNKQGMMETHIWEIKPHAQTIMPKKIGDRWPVRRSRNAARTQELRTRVPQRLSALSKRSLYPAREPRGHNGHRLAGDSARRFFEETSLELPEVLPDVPLSPPG